MTDGLPVLSGARLIRALEKIGWQVVRQRGSHVRLTHPDRAAFLVVPLHRELSAAPSRASCATPASTARSFAG